MKELIEEIAQWVIDNRYPKNEKDKISDIEMYHTLIDKLQALSQKSEGESKIYDIDFNGHILAKVEIINNQPKIIASMNGYGNAVDLDKITITPQTK